MLGHKARISDVILAPLKVGVLAALPLLAGVEIGNRAAAGEGISGAVKHAEATAERPHAFDDALAAGYRALATTLEKSAHSAGSNDWADAQYFALKAMAADRGENEGPEATSYWKLSPETQREIEAARSRVATAVDAGSQTDDAAAAEAAADAQVQFDCLVERSEEHAAADDCRRALEAALDRFDAAIGQGTTAATRR